jgi:hypothetical protein
VIDLQARGVLAQLALGGNALGGVVQHADELPLAADPHFTDADLEREDLAVLAPPSQLALADAHDARLAALHDSAPHTRRARCGRARASAC